MKANIDVHFEEVGAAVTNLEDYVKNLYDAGYRRVAATNTGSFTQYEDVKAAIAHIKEAKKKKGEDFDFEIIPAVKCYFQNTQETLTLIAKNYEGYQDLCKIITTSNELGTIIEEKNPSANKPIVYLDNLQENVRKGNLYLITGGPDSAIIRRLCSKKIELEKEIKALEKELSCITEIDGKEVSYELAQEILSFYQSLSEIKRPLKKEFDLAQKAFKITGDPSEITDLTARQERYEAASQKKKALEPMVKQLTNAMKPYKKQSVSLYDKKEEYETLSDGKEEAKLLFDKLTDIFGKENIYFELQNHYGYLYGESDDAYISNAFISFAKEIGHENFVAGNDTHIGISMESDAFEDELYRLSVARFLRDSSEKDGVYTPLNKEYEKQFCIKTEQQLKTGLSDAIDKTIHPDKETIIDLAIENTEKLIDSCIIIPPKQSNHYPEFCENAEAEFEKKCREGIPWRFPEGFSKEYKDRLNYELSIIRSMGYSSYHLIVQDYLEYARLLGYLSDKDVPNAPLTIPELEAYLNEKGISRVGTGIGPGRGSAAGSLCCYLLGITDIDPIKHGLLFERFLNPERVSMPDIDSDFRPVVRGKAKEYARNKYGFDNVCEIVTKSYHSEKGCIHDIARYNGAFLSAGKSKEEAKKIKDEWNKIGNMLAKKTEKYKEFDEFLEKETDLSTQEKYILNVIPKIQNLFTGFSKHAAGVIISKDYISSEIPLMWSSSSRALETQCQMASAEEKGYLKMDFLGLRNLAIITDTAKLVEKGGREKNREKILACQDAVLREKYILNNKAIFKEIFSKGLTQGVFQFESPGMKKMLMAFEPESFGDIVLLVAAYRPGPLDYIPEIIASKWYAKDPEHYVERMSKIYPPDAVGKDGKRLYANLYPVPQSSITLKNETLQKILAPTYNCPIYQEQIMQIFQEMAGYPLGRADEVRRAMSKKKEEKIAKERVNFIHGNAAEIEAAKAELENLKKQLEQAPENLKPAIRQKIDTFKIPKEIPGCMNLHGITEKEADDLFQQMMPFAKYGFNKSHAAAYAVVAMETAYQKLEYPLEFYASALNNWKDRDELEAYVSEFPAFGIHLLKPDIYHLSDEFEVEPENNGIRFSITKAKNFQSVADLKPTDNVFEFIMLNPNVSQTQLLSLNNLGLFHSCWSGNAQAKMQEEKRVDGNIAITKDFIKKHYKNIIKYGQALEQVKKENPSFPKITQKTAAYEEFTTLRTMFAQDKQEDMQAGRQIPTPEEILSRRKKEYELTGHIFCVEDDLKALNQCKNKNSFSVITDNHSSQKSDIPCIVADIDYTLRHTKNGNNYYNVTLMDKNGQLLTRRFSSPPQILKGVFEIQHNAYFFCSPKIKEGIADARQTSHMVEKFLETSKIPSPFVKNNVIESGQEAEHDL